MLLGGLEVFRNFKGEGAGIGEVGAVFEAFVFERSLAAPVRLLRMIGLGCDAPSITILRNVV